VDRMVLPTESDDEESRRADTSRLTDSVETAIRLGEGELIVAGPDADAFEDIHFSERFACVACGISLGVGTTKLFVQQSPRLRVPRARASATARRLTRSW